MARLMTKAGCKSVEIEQQLLPNEGEMDNIKGIEKGDESRRLLVCGEHAKERSLDIRVCDPFAPSYSQKPITSLVKSQEQEKKRKYNKRIS